MEKNLDSLCEEPKCDSSKKPPKEVKTSLRVTVKTGETCMLTHVHY